MLSAQLITVANRQIEMKLLGYRRVWPRRSQQAVDLLEGEAPSTVRREKYQPVSPARVGLPRTRGLVPGPVLVSKQLSVELCQCPGISRVQHDRTERWKSSWHTARLP